MFIGKLVNPIADARIEAGMSLTVLANRLSVSKQYISRAEHGTYSSLNNNLVRFAGNQLNLKPALVINKYNNFQNLTRQRTATNIKPEMLGRRTSKLAGNEIFTLWREGYWPSITSFSNAFCLHPELVRAYEEGIREEMPNQMRKVLNELKIIDPNWTEKPVVSAPIPTTVAEVVIQHNRLNDVKSNTIQAKYDTYMQFRSDGARPHTDF